jgi:hypothetical protein
MKEGGIFEELRNTYQILVRKPKGRGNNLGDKRVFGE